MRIRYLRNTPDILSASPLVLLEQDAPDPSLHQGAWRQVFGPFTKDKRLELEIGCGRGRFILDMATLHPGTLFIGNELVPTILARCSERIRKSPSSLKNVRLIQMDALKLTQVFAPHEVDRIYLNFSDPWPKKKHHKRRLTSPAFLKVYETALSPTGDLCFKTDNDDLFAFSLETLQEAGWRIQTVTDDLHHSPFKGANVMTEYEENFTRRGKNIHFVKALPPLR